MIDLLLLFKVVNLFDGDSNIRFSISASEEEARDKENAIGAQNRHMGKANSIDGKNVQVVYAPGKSVYLNDKGGHKATQNIDFFMLFKNIKKIKKSLNERFNQLNARNRFMGKMLASFDAGFKLTFINNLPKSVVASLVRQIQDKKYPVKIQDLFKSQMLGKEVPMIVRKLIDLQQTHIHYKSEDLTIELQFSGCYELKSFDVLIPVEYLTSMDNAKRQESISNLMDNHESLKQFVGLKKSRNQSRRLLRVQHDVDKIKSLCNEDSDLEQDIEQEEKDHFGPQITINKTIDFKDESGSSNDNLDTVQSPKSISHLLDSKSSMLVSKSINKLALNRKQTFSHFKTARAQYNDMQDGRGTKEFEKTYAMEFLPEDEMENENNKVADFNRSRTMRFANTVSIQRSSTVNNMKNIQVDITDFEMESIYQDVINAEKLMPYSKLLEWNFDALRLDRLQKFAVLYKIFKPHFMLTKISMPTFAAFLQKVETMYTRNKNPFHNFDHGVMVCHAANLFLSRIKKFSALLDDKLKFAFVLAALGHDLDHTGRNNNFEINSNSKLALRYSDKSPLEFHHIYKLFKIIHDKKTNLVSEFTVEAYKHIREFMIEVILATDMKYHFTHIDNFKMIVGQKSDFTVKDHLFSLAGLFVHSADLSAPTKETQVAMKWSRLVTQEFSAQYNDELAMGLPPTPYFKDLDIEINFYKSEINFLKFIIKPLYLTLEEYVKSNLDSRLNSEADGMKTLELGYSDNIDSYIDDGGLVDDIIGQIEANQKYYEKVVEDMNTSAAGN